MCIFVLFLNEILLCNLFLCCHTSVKLSDAVAKNIPWLSQKWDQLPWLNILRWRTTPYLWEQLFCILVWRGLSLISNHIRVCADLSVLLVRRGVVGDLEEVQVDDFFHLIVVSSTLTYNHRRIEQEDVPVVQRCHYVWRHRSNKSDLLHVITLFLSLLTEVLTLLSIFCVSESSCDGFTDMDLPQAQTQATTYSRKLIKVEQTKPPWGKGQDNKCIFVWWKSCTLQFQKILYTTLFADKVRRENNYTTWILDAWYSGDPYMHP